MTVRTATVVDADAVYELMCQLEDARFDRLTFCKRFAWQLARQPFFAFVLEEDDVVGFVNVRVERQLHHEHPVAEICELVVDKGCRGGGRGTLLLERAIARAQEQGCEVIEVASNAARLGAHRFYEKHGMKRTHAKFMMGLRGP